MKKKRVSVKELITCPSFKPTKDFEIVLKMANRNHSKAIEILKEKGYEVEVPVSLRVGSYTIHGRLDGIDRKRLRIAEVKPFAIRYDAIRQAMLYRDMLFVLEGRAYQVVLYRYSRIDDDRIVVFPSMGIMPFTGEDIMVMYKEAIKVLNNSITRIRCELCGRCDLLRECEPQAEWRGKRLIMKKRLTTPLDRTQYGGQIFKSSEKN